MIPFKVPRPENLGYTDDLKSFYMVTLIQDENDQCIKMLTPWCKELVERYNGQFNYRNDTLYFHTEEDLALFKLSLP